LGDKPPWTQNNCESITYNINFKRKLNNTYCGQR
jgi:hypothetical protein